MIRIFFITVLAGISLVTVINTGEAKLHYSPLWLMDTNKDNMISKDEFIAYGGKVFTEHDKKGIGLMTNTEIEAMMQKECAAMREELIEEKR